MDIISQILRPEIIVPFVPISAILGGVYLISLNIKYKALSRSLNNDEIKMIQKAVQENESLKQRITNLENIVTSLDQDLLNFDKTSASQKKLGE